MKNILLIPFFIFSTWSIYAQQDADAINFSRPSIGGTARNMGAGGIFGSVGADYSTVINNPGGLGLFNRGEMSISPSFVFSNSKSTYLGITDNDLSNRFVMSNAALVFTKKRSGNHHLKTSTWAIGVNRISNFNNSQNFSSTNSRNSYGEALANKLTDDISRVGGTPIYNNNILDPNEYKYFGFKQLNAYDTYLLDYDKTTQKAYAPTIGTTSQSCNITTTGGINELGINWGGNFVHKFNWGVGLNIDFINYKQSSIYTEEDSGKTNLDNFLSFQSTDNLKITGTGINLKTGIIYKVNDYVRLSGFIHTPTYYSITENYSNNFVTRILNKEYSAQSPLNNFSYNLYTPWKAGVGVSGFFNKRGFLAFEYEYLDYRSAFVDFTGDTKNQSAVNNLISNKYNNGHTFKFGGEASIDQLRLRAGYVYQTSIFNKSIAPVGAEQKTQYITCGLGYRGDSFGFDLAYIKTLYNSYYNLYTAANGEVMGAVINNNINQLVATFTFKF